MSTQPITHRLHQRAAPRVLSWRPLAVSLLGPLTAVGGLAWAIVQPYRVTLLHPRAQGFWWLAVEPPLLVILAGVAFHLLVARPLVRELEER
jgi:hypothetical protein